MLLLLLRRDWARCVLVVVEWRDRSIAWCDRLLCASCCCVLVAAAKLLLLVVLRMVWWRCRWLVWLLAVWTQTGSFDLCCVAQRDRIQDRGLLICYTSTFAINLATYHHLCLHLRYSHYLTPSKRGPRHDVTAAAAATKWSSCRMMPGPSFCATSTISCTHRTSCSSSAQKTHAQGFETSVDALSCSAPTNRDPPASTWGPHRRCLFC